MTIASGTRFGPYEVLAPLGAGGMGEVYRARDGRLDREVAIKVLPAELASDASRLKRFEKEARAASSLNHPNIVTIYDLGLTDGVSWIAMERVEGKTLRELLASGALPVRRVLAIGAQIADGLSKAHEVGIVHRDLKPENVMVTKDGLVKILDFGLAKLGTVGSGSGEVSKLPTETGTSPGVVLGTVGYMSPEQASGHGVDFRSDQFALGSILYEMATGKRAFAKKTAVDTLSAILNDDPEPIAVSSPQTPAPLRWLVERCLAKDPEGRYVSTKDLEREIVTMRDRLSEASLSGAASAVSPSPRRRHVRAGAWTLATLTILLAGFFAGVPVWKARFSSRPTIRQLTFRRSGIQDARFAPDGQIVYAALPELAEGDLGELLSTRPGAFEPRSLGLPPANILSISSSGEMAILVGGAPRQGTLATVPLAGGAPRELLEKVRHAAWTPDGKSLAVIHVGKTGQRLEFPIGKVLYEPQGFISGLQFSPKGDLIAFSDHASFVPGAAGSAELTVMDLAGKRRKIPKVPSSEIRWSPDGDEIWFPEILGGTTSIWATTLSGQKRLLASFPGDFVFHDLARDGRALLERVIEEFEIVGRFQGDPAERNLSWLDGSVPAALSADGKTLLFSERGQAGPAIYKRKTDGSPAVRLGEGTALDLSPDGLWALCAQGGPASHLVLLPTGAGQPRTLTLPGNIFRASGAGFFPDGKRVLVRGAEPGHGTRLFALDIESGKAHPFTPEGASGQSELSISPDGRRVVSSDGYGESVIYDVDGGASRPVPGLSEGLYVIRWCADGHSLFVRTSGIRPLKVYRLDLSTGRMELWREFSVSDIGAGLVGVIPTPDGRSYVYGYKRYFSDLFIAEGLK